MTGDNGKQNWRSGSKERIENASLDLSYLLSFRWLRKNNLSAVGDFRDVADPGIVFNDPLDEPADGELANDLV